MGAAHEIVVIDVARAGGIVEAREERLERPLDDKGRPLDNIPMRTFWSREQPPQGSFALGGGVIYVQQEPGLAPPPADPVLLTQGADGSFSYQCSLRHIEGGILMVVLILPAGEAANFGNAPNAAKVIQKRNRLAVYWIVDKSRGHHAIELVWNLRAPNGTLEQEAEKLNPRLSRFDKASAFAQSHMQDRSAAAINAGFMIDLDNAERLAGAKHARPDQKTARRLSPAETVSLAVAVLTLLVGILAIPGVTEHLNPAIEWFKAPVPLWSDTRDAYVGDSIVLNWRFPKQGSLAFEVEHARDERFRTDAKRFFTDVYEKPGNEPFLRRVEEIRNDARFFRVRAVNSSNYTALSGWSDARRMSQYESSYQRIAETRSVVIGISKIDHNDLFKWAGSVRDGIDIRLVHAITAELPARIGGPALAEGFDPIAWPDILYAPALGRVDMAVAAISRGPKRELEHGISFSDPYFCTTQALIYRTGELARSAREMIAGRRVGFEKHSTSERLVTALADDISARGGKTPELHGDDRPENIPYAVSHRAIDIGVTDLPFAAEAVLTARHRGDPSLSYSAWKKAELPPKENQPDEYAIALRRGDPLVPLVDEILKQIRSSGALTRLVQATTRDYEQFKGFAQGELAAAILQTQPWECPVN